MTIPAGAPAITLFAGTPVYTVGSATVALACDPDVMEPSAPMLKIGQKDTDGSFKQVAAADITGIQTYDPGLALAGVFNFCQLAGRANWDGPSAQTLANTTPVAQLVALIMPWLNGPLATQYGALLTQAFGGQSVTPPPISTNVSLLDLIHQWILAATITSNANGTITVAHP